MTTRSTYIASTGTPAKSQGQARQPAYSVLAIAGLTVVLCACVPDLGPMTGIKSVDVYVSGNSLAAPEGVWPESEWWHGYGAPQLDRLIAEALDGSPDLRIAEARFRQAEAAAGQAGAALWPEISAQGSATAIHQSLHQGFPDSFQSFLPHGWRSQGTLTANLDYEIDLFGKNRAALAAATSEGEAAQIDAIAARLALSVAVAEAYADLVQLDADRRADEDALRVRTDSAKLVNDRFQQQLENSGEVAQAQSRVAATRADLDVVNGQLALTRNRISALVGQGPDRGLDIAFPELPKLHAFGVPRNLAADLLGRRADIVAARLRVEAAAKRIDVARADFYPNVDLTAYIGQQSIGISDLFTAQSRIGQIGPAVSLPLFDGGRRKAVYRGSRAVYDEAVADYDKTLTLALKDVADALANARELAAELIDARAALAASQDAYRIATLRYKGGLSRYLDVLTAEDTQVEQQRRVATLQARAFAEDIALISAVGGGFVYPAPALALNDQNKE